MSEKENPGRWILGYDWREQSESMFPPPKWSAMRETASYLQQLERVNLQLTEALKLAYRKHHVGDDSIGWDELSDHLCNALCESIGDKEFQAWLERV